MSFLRLLKLESKPAFVVLFFLLAMLLLFVKDTFFSGQGGEAFGERLPLWVAMGLFILGFVVRGFFASQRGDHLSEGWHDSTKPSSAGHDPIRPLKMDGEYLPRLVGLHAGSITACASELISVRDLIRADADTSQTTAVDVSVETNNLGQEISSVKQAIERVSDNILKISSTSEELSTSITAIASASEQASDNISTVASAAEEITSNIGGVTRSLSQVDQSLQRVTLSIQEMTNALGEVRERSLLASRESGRVNQHALGSRSIMTELSESAREIGDVVEIINSIAEQTNMLALNASIEAAGAGDAGKGFAVVANEVKELARQTGKATQMIAQKADNIQQKSDMASAVNTEITSGIGRIDQGNSEISLAMDEQAEAIRGIADAMNTVAEATAEVTRNTRELNQAAQDVAQAAQDSASLTTGIAQSAAVGANGAVAVAQSSSEALTFANTIVDAAKNTEHVSGRLQEKMRDVARTASWMYGSARHFNLMGTVLQQITNALYISQIEMETGPPPFNIRALKQDALHWQGILEQMLHGRIEGDPLPQEDVCHTCLWFAEKGGGKLGEAAAFKEARRIHKEIHALVLSIVALLAESGEELAREKLNLYASARAAYFKKLDLLYLGDAVAQESQLFLPWSDRLSVGIKEVDDDHKQLISLVNRLHRTMKDGGDATALGAILTEAAEYTQVHFSREEAMMRRYDYPGLADQQEEHRRMVHQLSALATQFSNGDFPVAMDIMAFAKVWLTKHILGTDMKLKPFFAQKNS